MPMIAFPSGFTYEIWPGFSCEDGALVHLFGEIDLPLFSILNEAYTQATFLADQYDYFAQIGGSMCIDGWRHVPLTYLEVTYDDEARRMIDVQRIK